MRWPTKDWEHAGGLYKGIKYLATRPVKFACRLHARGLEHMPREGGIIVAVNHWSYWDPILVAAYLPRPLVHLAKSGLFKTRFTRWFFGDLAGQIPVDRKKGGNVEAVRLSLEALEAGRALSVYPEATRSDPPDLLPGHTGVARLAYLSGAPIVPVGCLSDRFWSRRHTVPRFGRRTYVNVGPPMRVPRDAAAADDREATRNLTDDVMGRIRALLDEAASARDRAEAWPWKGENGRIFARTGPQPSVRR